jgi:hypothetical protein
MKIETTNVSMKLAQADTESLPAYISKPPTKMVSDSCS